LPKFDEALEACRNCSKGPFAGAGMGLVSVTAPSFQGGMEFTDSSLEIGYKTAFEFLLRIGFEKAILKPGWNTM